jgi:glycosyltransferase A (GT-A) superfamily protein (DUF2064 family)
VTRALVMAKAPVPGRVKTRLGADVGTGAATELAAAALLDTLAVCSAAFSECHLALEGALQDAVERQAIRAALRGWHLFEQAGGGLGARLAHAHRTVAALGGGPVVQVGMDTPQMTTEQLRVVAGGVGDGGAVLGPAQDGGWWVLALVDGLGAGCLVDVPRSTATTHDLTRDALLGEGLQVRPTAMLRDVDTVADAASVATAAPQTRFAAAWRRTVGAS